jgi:hypothetical protein
MDRSAKFQLIILCFILLAIFFVAYKVSEKRDEQIRKEAYELATAVKKAMENCYAQGQVYALNGDVRIRKINDSTFVWTKSPWLEDSTIPTDTIKIKFK